MIPIPQSLKFKRDPPSEKKLLKEARERLASAKRSPGIHASDLLDPRRTWFRYKSGDKEAALTDQEVMVFLVGRVLHAMILGAEDEGSRTSELGFDYSIDFMDGDCPTELKSTRMKIPKDRGKLEQYIEQVLIYMACEQKTKGQLWVLFLNAKDENWLTCPMFRCATITISKKDMMGLRTHLKDLTNQLNLSLTSRKKEAYRELPLCRGFLCKRGRCPDYDVCKPEGRWKPKRKYTKRKVEAAMGW